MKKVLLSAVFAATISAQAQSFESFSLQNNETYWNGSDYSGYSNGSGLFDSTFVENNLEFWNQYDTTWGAIYGYWSNGWAFSNETSDSTQGYSGLYSSFAGGASTGSNYVIGMDGSEITVQNGLSAYFLNLHITNNNYAASSMQNGDNFAKPFGSPNDASGNPDGTNGEDWFLLTIKGVDAQGAVVDSVLFYLADYRFSDSTQDYIVKNWTNVDLSTLGPINKITFSLSSSDVGQYGMNTPGFFALDDITLSYTNINKNALSSINAYPNPAHNFITINTPKNGFVKILDGQGRIVYSKNTFNSITTIDLSSLISGIYFIRIETENTIEQTRFIKY